MAAWVSLSPAWVSLEAGFALRDSLALCLSSLSVTVSRRHHCLSVSLRLVALAFRSLTFLSSSFFFFFFLWFLLSSFGFGLLRAEIFSFFFFVVVD